MANPDRDNEFLRLWDREHVWHAFTQMAEYEPFIIDRAHGCTLVDIDGREYLDGVSSLWCNVHGHRHPAIDQAIVDQLGRVAHVTSLGASNPTTIRLARKLTELAPAGLEHVFFSGDGSSAVEVALKMSFQYWRQRAKTGGTSETKTRFVAIDSAYHGDTIGSVSVGGVARFHDMFRPLLFDVERLAIPDMYRLPEGVSKDGALEYFLRRLETVLQKSHSDISAVVIEPLVQCAAGMIVHPPGFLRGVRELTRRYNVLMIADEVAVGIGRTGKLFACEHEEVSPDFLCIGKGLTGGYLAMAATLTSAKIFEAFLGKYEESKTFFHGHSYGGNPLAAAAALATLGIFEAERTLDLLEPKIERLAMHLRRISQLTHVGDVRQRGTIVGIELVKDRATKTGYDWSERVGIQVCQEVLKHGVWLRPLGNVVVIMPPLTISIAQIDLICESVESAISTITERN